jgi:glycosyltransferase involved in cell wall biosynthesis
MKGTVVQPARPVRHQATAPLRIAIVAPPWYELPPDGYGGIEAVCATLVDQLVDNGHEVTVFGVGKRCGTAGRFVSLIDEPQYLRLGEAMPAALYAALVRQALADGDFDVVHDHSPCGPLIAPERGTPTVVTVHGPVDGELGDYFVALGDCVWPVAISESQRRSRPDLRWAATVHNAVEPARFVPAPPTDGPVLWLARMSPDKGPDLAIEACRTAGVPLILAGKCNEATEQRYLEVVIRPLLHDGVELVLNADRPTTARLLARARCVIVPVRWREPFGMVMVEAMASGRPVVALRRGAVPEIVRHGVTGWLCDDPVQLPDALHRVAELDPLACVAHVQASFSAELMARRYEAVYRRAVAAGFAKRVAERSLLWPLYST